MSIVPDTLSVKNGPTMTQPAKSSRTESGTRSPSALPGDAGLRAGVQPDAGPAGALAADATRAAGNGLNAAPDSVAASRSPWTSDTTTSPRLSAWAAERAGRLGALLSVHAATPSAKTARAVARFIGKTPHKGSAS